MGGQTALNVAMALARARRAREVRRRADRRERATRSRWPRTASCSSEAMERIGLAVAAGGIADDAATRRWTIVERDRLPGDHPPVVHARRHGRRHRVQPRGVRGRSCAAASTSRRCTQVLVERSVHRLEGVRARGDARPRRQRRHRLLDREPRPDGRAHRRLDHRRAGDDAHRPRVPDDARRGASRSSARSASTRAAATSSSR